MKVSQTSIYVFGDWIDSNAPVRVGTLYANRSRGKEIFSFAFEESFLQSHPQM